MLFYIFPIHPIAVFYSLAKITYIHNIYVMVSRRQDAESGDASVRMREIDYARKVGPDDYVVQTLLVAIQASTRTRTMLRYKAFLSVSIAADDASEYGRTLIL